jgi:2-oxoglutarate ferredoxin oxidoreductase subunit beta
VARLFAGDPDSITAAIMEGVRHTGFSFFHVYTTCLTFDKQYKTWDHLKSWVHPLPKGYKPTNRKNAIMQVLDDDFSMGIIYKKETEPIRS